MGIPVAPRISFRQMHDMGLGKSLSYVFVPAYSASQILCFVLFAVFVLLRSQMWNPYLSSSVLIFSMGVVILLIIEIVMSILSNRCASFQVDPIISTFARSPLSFLNGVCFIRPKLFLFSRPPTPFSSRTHLF